MHVFFDFNLKKEINYRAIIILYYLTAGLFESSLTEVSVNYFTEINGGAFLSTDRTPTVAVYISA